MALAEKKKQALQLRKNGSSVGGIARTLGISKGTASLWCRDVVLTAAQSEVLRKNSIAGGYQGRLLGAEMNRKKKVDAIAYELGRARTDIGTLSKKGFIVLMAGLYWAEGSKTDSRFTFVNSDADMVAMMCRFLHEVMGIEKERIALVVQVNSAHRSRIQEITKFWSKRLSISRSQFGNPYFVQTVSKKIYENHNDHYGTIRLRVLKSSGLQYRMLGYINALKEQYAGVSKSWISGIQ